MARTAGKRGGGARAAGARAATRRATSPAGRFWRGLAIVGLLLVAAFLILQFWFFAHILWWREHPPGPTAFMRAELARLQETHPKARLRHEWVPYAQINDSLKRAVIAAEDANFTEHDGVDWDAIERAYDQNLRKGKVVRGGSTITMQLAKNLFLSGERSYLRKGLELTITWQLEWLLSKERILEIYLNVAEWGEGVFGCAAASEYYFGQAPSRLGPAQSARLAAMLPRPRFYDKNRQSSALGRRAAMIQRGLQSVEPP